MLSKAKISLINSLMIKKYRDKHNLFIAEGEKIVKEILNSNINVKYLFAETNVNIPESTERISEVITISEREIKRISQLKTPSKLIAIAEIPNKKTDFDSITNEICIAFEDIQNPGNLGSIIRTCDWFGIKNVFLSENSVDLYSPKTIQATAGAFLRINVHYTNLDLFVKDYIKKTGNQCYGTFLTGENIYTSELKNRGLIIFGNEGKGISTTIEKLISKKIYIPNFSTKPEQSESLNISSAVSVVCSEFKRNKYK
jgi:RNA methyltransferase, TrmH family